MVTKKQILAQLQELTDLIKSDEFNRLKKDSDELKRIESLLSHIHFKVKDVRIIDETQSVLITYEMPRIELKLDDKGEFIKDEFFYASNILELISLEDTQKIQTVLDNFKERKEK